jgi:hypothetical protein
MHDYEYEHEAVYVKPLSLAIAPCVGRPWSDGWLRDMGIYVVLSEFSVLRPCRSFKAATLLSTLRRPLHRIQHVRTYACTYLGGCGLARTFDAIPWLKA